MMNPILIQMNNCNLEKTMLTREEIHQTIEETLIPLCAGENKAAQAYLKRLFFIVRKLDDLWDEDYIVSKADIAKSLFLALNELPANSFYQENYSALIGAQVISFNAWMDANTMMEQDSNPTKAIYAHVLRDYICEIFPLVAYLTGGEAHMREVSPIVRKTFEKPLGQ